MAYDRSSMNDVMKFAQISARVVHGDTITGSVLSGSTGLFTSATIPTVHASTLTGSVLSGSLGRFDKMANCVRYGGVHIAPGATSGSVVFAPIFPVGTTVYVNTQLTGSVSGVYGLDGTTGSVQVWDVSYGGFTGSIRTIDGDGAGYQYSAFAVSA